MGTMISPNANLNPKCNTKSHSKSKGLRGLKWGIFSLACLIWIVILFSRGSSPSSPDFTCAAGKSFPLLWLPARSSRALELLATEPRSSGESAQPAPVRLLEVARVAIDSRVRRRGGRHVSCLRQTGRQSGRENGVSQCRSLSGSHLEKRTFLICGRFSLHLPSFESQSLDLRQNLNIFSNW